MLNASPAAQNLVASYNGGKVSAQGMATAQNAAKASSIGLTIAQTALNAAIGMGIGLLINLVVQGVNKLIHANEEAIEKAEELRSKYEEFKNTNESNVSTLKGLENEFKELSKGVSQYGDNISLTTEQYERYKEIIQQIVGMSPSLAEGYDTENGYIADKNGLLERAIELQEIEYRNELRKITNLENLKISMAGYIAEYKDAFEDGWVTEDMSATSTKKATDFSNALYQAFNFSERYNDGYSSEDLAREILKSLGIDNIDKEMEKFFNENGYYQPNWFFDEYVDEIANNIDAVTNALSFENVGLDEDEFENRILTVKDCAQAYLDMKDSISMANESIQTDLRYIAEYAEGYDSLSSEQQKFVNEFLKGFNIDDITSRDWFGNLTYDEDKMKSVKRQINDFVEALSKDESTKNALADLYAIPTDDQSISEFVEQFRSALEIIKSYCEENGIEIPIAITDSEKEINELEAQYQRTVDYAKDKFNGYDPTAFFKESSINTQEEVDKWLEIAQAANSAAEAEEKYLASIPSTINFDSTSFLESVSAIQSGYEKLLSAQEEFNEYGAITASTLKDLMDNDLIQYLQFTADGLSINTQALENEEQALKDEATAKLYSAMCNDIQNLSLNDTSILSPIAQTALKNLDSAATIAGENAAIAAQGWWEYGASIQSIPGISDLTGDNYKKALAIVDQYKNIANSINSLSIGNTNSTNKSSSSTKDTWKEAFQSEYDTLKHNLEMEYITEEQYYNSLNALNQKYFAGKSEYLDEYRKYEEEVYKGLKSIYKDYVESYLSYMKQSLESSRIDYKTYSSDVAKFLKDMYDQGKIAAKDYFDYTQEMLEVQKSIYDKAISGMVYILDQELDRLDKEKELIESNYQAKIDAIQAEIDALEEANQKRQDQIDLEKAQYELERAQNQRTQKVNYMPSYYSNVVCKK